MIVAATFDWSAFGMALGTVFVAIVTAWNTYKAGKTAKVVETIHTLTNSSMGEALFIGMVSAKALVSKDFTPENLELFHAAERKYLDHQRKQALVDDASAHEKQAHASGIGP